MNNNRGNNTNRRRGRGNNRQQGGGQQTNRIDSRARGNAPQMLEKYRKLAHDAHLNGDRVTEEYNLQFADHYFRVIADQKQRQEESRQPRRDDQRPSEYGDDYSQEYDPYGETPSMPGGHGNDRADRGNERPARPDRDPRFDREPRGERDQRREREPRPEREPRVEATEAPADSAEAAFEPKAEPQPSMYEPPENPFVRDSRGAGRGLKQRKPRRPRDGEDGDFDRAEDAAPAPAPVDEQAAPEAAPVDPVTDFDAATLPPAIASKPRRGRPPAQKPAVEAAEAVADDAASAAPAVEEKPRRRRTRKVAGDDAGATPEAVNG